MGGKQRLGTDLLRINEVLDDSPGNAQAVKRARAPPDLVQHNQGLGRRIEEDVRHFVHLHHERGLAACQVVRCADARKDAVNDADFGRVSRNKAAHMRHQRDKRYLTHVCALARHIGASDDQHAVVLIIHQRAVWHKLFVPAKPVLDDRMPSVLDVDDAAFRHMGSDIAVLNCGNRQRNQRVERLEAKGRLLDARNLRGQEIPDFSEQRLLEPHRLFMRAQYRFLDFVELRRRVALAVGQRLFARVPVRHLIVIGLGHFNIVAKYLIVLNLEVLDFRQFAFSGFKIQYPLLSVPGGRTQLIKLLTIALPDTVAIAHDHRRIGIDGARQLLHDVVKRRQEANDLPKEACGLQF